MNKINDNTLISFGDCQDKNLILDKMSALYSEQFNLSISESKKILLWKYIKNPFGDAQGYILVDNESYNIITMRMLTPWKMRYVNNSFSYLQPSDSATANLYKGKGYFSKLTKISLESFSFDGLFNFPNSQSINTYKKLNFELFACKKPKWKIIIPKLFCKKATHQELDQKDIPILVSFLQNFNKFSTDWCESSLKWRLIDNPKFKYYVIILEECFVVYKLHPKNENVVDIVLTSSVFSNNLYNKIIQKFSSKRILMLRYFGFNTQFYDCMNNDLFTFSLGTKLNITTFNIDNDKLSKNMRIELAESDFA